MFCQWIRSYALIVISTWALLLPGVAVRAQAPPLDPDDPSPATRHAQVIAHGMTAMPADEIGWRVVVDRAAPLSRAKPNERLAGFILADEGVVALVDEDGERLARIAPGEAIWNELDVTRAVVGIKRKAPAYYDIALVPATDLTKGDSLVIGGAPFVAPLGDAFDVDLIRDVLNRAEESVVSTGPSPALVLVTSGVVYVESTSGGLVEMMTGQATQVAGDVVITGASRVPAAFAVARIGPEVPPHDASDSPSLGTPTAVATPGVGVEGGSVEISASLCPIAYVGGNDIVECAAPGGGVGFNLMSNETVTATSVANEEGDVSFTGIQPGHYTLIPERPADFATSRVRCRTASGDVLAARTTMNQFVLLLAAGDEVICTWYLVPTEVLADTPPDSTVPAAEVSTPEETDPDGDGLPDAMETALGTDPLLADSDVDGVSDGDEIDFFGTNALEPDTDDDGLDDAEELLTIGTNPLLADTDADDVSDNEEVDVGTDPRDTSSVPATPTPIPTLTPKPTLEPTLEPELDATPEPPATSEPTPDVELDLESEPETESEPEAPPARPDDLDKDGVSNADEVNITGTNIAAADSDGDGANDGDEIEAGTDPLDPTDA